MKNDILNGIKNIVFDFGCVLVDLDRHKCIEALNAIGAHKISCYVDECKQADMFLDLELGKISVEEFCDTLCLGRTAAANPGEAHEGSGTSAQDPQSVYAQQQ